MKTLYMETTKKSPEETCAEIQKILKEHDLTQFMLDYDNGEIAGVFFAVKVNDQDMPFKLPINHKPLWKLSQNGETKYIKTEEQAKRVAWRQILKWIEAQIALIDINMVKLEQVFLPYLIVDHQKNLTLFDKYDDLKPMLEGKK